MKGLELISVRQLFDRPAVVDISGTVERELDRLELRIGRRVAIGVGSRGVANVAAMVQTAVSWLRRKGAEPFIVPAMGSHGGATGPGQAEILAGYGITEETVSAPVISSMEVAEITAPGLPHRLFMDATVQRSDGVLLINRIKPHTDFHGRIESGLIKMAVIGLGKKQGAQEIHQFGIRGLRDYIVPAFRKLQATGKILAGIGVVENACDETAIIESMIPDDFEDRESRLLDRARRMMPSLPVDDLDLLVVDEFGKDVSGCGLDTNIIGRIRIDEVPEPESPRIRRIVLLDLTDRSHGNALGVGLGDVITRRVYDKIDLNAMRENVVTSTFLQRGMIPIVADTDLQAVEFALGAGGEKEWNKKRIIRIRNTLRLDELRVSPPVLREIRERESIQVLDRSG